MTSPETERPDPDRLETSMARLLLGGVVISTVVLIAGLVMHFSNAANAPRVIQTGVLLLIATPWLRVVLSLGLFLRMRDNLYVMVCLILLATMIAGLLLGA